MTKIILKTVEKKIATMISQPQNLKEGNFDKDCQNKIFFKYKGNFYFVSEQDIYLENFFQYLEMNIIICHKICAINSTYNLLSIS